jgi:branched-chain amino acid transport system substrate-binding protein
MFDRASHMSLPENEHKYALVVGVNASVRMPLAPPLRYAQTDAVGISWLLTRPSSDFTLVDHAPLVGDGASTQRVRQSLLRLLEQKSEDDLVLFYFIGYSCLLPTNEGMPELYLVTADFDPQEAERDPSSHLSLRWLQRMLLERNKNASALIVLDFSCVTHMLPSSSVETLYLQTLDAFVNQTQVVGQSQSQPARSWAMVVSTDVVTSVPRERDHRHEGSSSITELMLDSLGGRDRQSLDTDGNLTLETLCASLEERTSKPSARQPNYIVVRSLSARTCILAHHPTENPVRRERGDFTTRSRESGESAPAFVPTSFDTTICKNADFTSDLDFKQIEQFLRKERVLLQEDYRAGSNVQEQMEALGFLGGTHPSYGALLCFGQYPSRQIAGAYTRCIYWKDTRRLNGWIDDKELRGGLLQQFEQARNFLQKHLGPLNTPAQGEQSKQLDIPLRVLEEALCNALIHREYVTEPHRLPRVERVVVEIFSDRIDISSPGGLPPNVSLQSLQNAQEKPPGSHPRNPQITRIFYLDGFVDYIGTGIARMQTWMEQAGLREPEFHFDPGTQTFMITLYRPEPAAVAEAETVYRAATAGHLVASADQGTRQPSATPSFDSTHPSETLALPTQPVPRPHPPRAFRLSWPALVLLAVLLIGLAGGGWGITAWLRGPLAVPAPSPASLLPTQAPISRTIEIASDFPTSSLDTTNGLPLQHGVQMAISTANNNHLIPGYTLKLVPYDDVGRNNLHDPQTGARNITQAITDGLVAGIIGPENSSVALSELPLANQAPIALISPTTTYPCLTKGPPDDPDCSGNADLQAQLRPSGQVTFFRLATTDDQLGKAMADYLYTTEHYRKALLLKDDSDVYSFGLALPFQREWSQLGGALVPLDLPQDQSSVQNYQDLLQTVASIQPDLIYFAGGNPNGSYVLRALSTIASLKTTALAGGDALIDTDFLQVANQVRRTAPIYASTPIVDPEHAGTAVGANFQDNYNASGYGDYDIYAATAYDCAMALIQAIKQALQRSTPPRGERDLAGARRFRQAIVQALRHLVLQAGATGRHSFDANGDSTSHTVSFYRLDVSGGQPVWQWIKQVGA